MTKLWLPCLLGLLLLTNTNTLQAQRKKAKQQEEETTFKLKESPKLVVGIVVDQMRYDYITRFWDHYGEGGFKRLVSQGFNCKNNHYNYVPTYTGPGHASVYTGTTPAVHGIIGNDWYDKVSGKSVYCAGDDQYTSLGTTSDDGQMSPHRMSVSTITDQLRLHTQKRGKVIAISLKDRGAVLPGGHMANAAYWFEGGALGSWISSSYYMEQLPEWVQNFNAARSVDQYRKVWDTAKNIGLYAESGTDNNGYEAMFTGETASTFPHNLPALWDSNGMYSILKTTPYGNSITTDFALAALEAEQLGTDGITDFFAVSYSSTDYVGHAYGVNSKEVQDTYIRLDMELERLLNALDKQVGGGEYTLFLTADHGACHVSGFLKDEKVPAGYISYRDMVDQLKEFIEFRYGTKDLIKNISNGQLFLDHKVIANLGLDLGSVQEVLARELLAYAPVKATYTANQMWYNQYTEGLASLLQKGHSQKRSGDVMIVLESAYTNYGKHGSTHGTAYTGDTHVPLLFYGKGIPTGSTVTRTAISDIAPTMAALLGIAFPSGSTGTPISAILE